MKRALAVLTGGAVLTLLLEATDAEYPLAAVTAGSVFALLAVLGFSWVDGQPAQRRRRFAVGYVAVMLPLGFLVFGAADAGVGATLLLMVLVSQSVLLLPLPAAALVAAVLPLVHLGMTWGDGLRNGLGILAAAAFTAVVTELLKREQQARAELDEANRQLRGYAAQAEELATTQERNRVARDIHDGLGHHLTVVAMQVQAARAVLATDPSRADAVLAKAQQQSTEALAEVRRSVAALRGPRATPPLADGLAALAADTSAAGVPTDVHVEGSVRTLPADAEECLYRVAQEGLTNVRKHAAASRARVVLDYRDTAAVRLEVCDDGRGLPSQAADGGGFGLVGLRERAARLGGRVTLDREPAGGTTLRVEVPG
ncbi:sensor histidine kinase [Blastococcus deserti]|uniref:Oxygen sensor histidine kinase NreB n=1 Tax=Blastococcus deserti TaxID=2259033 RepID=A0ABW4XEX7_9ACTN